MTTISQSDAKLDPRLQSVELRHRYAAEWLQRPSEPYSCAVSVLPGPENINVSALAGQLWQHDPIVHEEMARIRGALGAASGLPSKDRFALDLYEMAGDKTKGYSDRLAAYRMLGDTLGYIPRAGMAPVDAGTMGAQNVMRLPPQPEMNAWELSAGAQQQQLIAEATNELASATVN